LGGTSACSFFVILHENSLLGACFAKRNCAVCKQTCDSPAASFSYNLMKDLTAHLHHQLCAVLPQKSLLPDDRNAAFTGDREMIRSVFIKFSPNFHHSRRKLPAHFLYLCYNIRV
ncbi:MAG: hypothetical protein IJ060_10725, partial [Oscillospiraceae bacterium]|nr:hypothetical protein [Oscillospiraceae bacterium]